jgi:hypothetical protein
MEVIMKETALSKRKIIATLAVITGLFMIIAAPIIIQISLERVVGSLLQVIEERPAFSSGILLFSFAFPIYRGLIFIGGIILILIALPIYKGEEWTYPVGLLSAAFPSAGAMFIFLPYVSWVDGFPLPIIISLMGLVFFWSIILLRKADNWLRWGHFLSLTVTGMLTTHAFVIFIGNMRMLLTRPMKPLYDGLEWWILSLSAPIQFICVILFFLTIYLLAARKQAGWWSGIIAGTSVLVINIPTQIIRTTMTDSTSLDYLMGGVLAAGLLFVLLYPKFKAALIDHGPLETPTTIEPLKEEKISALSA